MELLLLVCLCLLSCSGDAVKVVVEEDSDAVLPCFRNPKEDLTRKAFDWKNGSEDVFFHASAGHSTQGPQFIGRVSHFQDQLKNGDASIKISKTEMADSGTYSCIFPHLQTFYIELVVGAAPRPYIDTLAETNHWSLLQCEAHGVPLPTLKWEDSDNNTLPAEEPHISERGGRSYITVKITVTKTDNYSCVATQETLSHQVATVTSVVLTGAASKPSVKTIQTDEGMMLLCEVLGVSPKPKVEWKDSSGNVLPVKDLKEIERGGSYDIILQAALTKTDNFSCVVTQEGSYSPLSAEIYAVAGSNTGAIVGGVVGVAALIIIVLVAVIIILCRKLRNPGSTPVAAKGQPDANEGTKMIASE